MLKFHNPFSFQNNYGLNMTKTLNYDVLDASSKEESQTHIHKLSRPGRYLGGNLAKTRKFLASERKFFGQQLTVAAAKSSSTTIGIKSKFFVKMKISKNFVC